VWLVVISPLNKKNPQTNVVDIDVDTLKNGDKAVSKLARVYQAAI